MLTHINNAIYLEIVDKYKRYIELGIYKLDDKLPSIRTIASELGINPNTVARAFKILEDEKYIKSIPKKGLYVSYQANKKTDSVNHEIKEKVELIKLSGITKKNLLKIIEEVYDDKD